LERWVLLDESETLNLGPPLGAGVGHGRPPESHTRASEPIGGVRHEARPDLGRSGRGGSLLSHSPALNLASSVDGLTLQRLPLNHSERHQAERVESAQRRASFDDRRALRRPMHLWLHAFGNDVRRVPSRHEVEVADERASRPAVGAERSSPIAFEPSDAAWGWPGLKQGAVSELGRIKPVPAVSERIALARPSAERAQDATLASTRDSVKDTVDSDQQIATRVASLIDASSAGGPQGPGVGGEPAARAVGSGGQQGAGSRSRASGTGGGGQGSRLAHYARRILDSVKWHDAFPNWAIAAGRGGVAIVGMTLRADGSVSDLRLLRGSGVAEFDRNLLRAVARAAPFDPIPSALGRRSLPLSLSFDATNPAIGRHGQGPGGRAP
jgi:TonB family protein